jgi:hypothetical protein
MAGSLRRKRLRLLTGVNRKLSVIWWIGCSVARIVTTAGRQITGPKGPSESSRKSRRGQRRGRRRSRGGNPRSPPTQRPLPTRVERVDKRQDRAEAWMLKLSSELADQVQRMRTPIENVAMSPFADRYREAASKVWLVTGRRPISFRLFVLQCRDDSPWNAEPDMCTSIRTVDLESMLVNTNIFFESQHSTGAIRMVPKGNKTPYVLCRLCGSRTPGAVCGNMNCYTNKDKTPKPRKPRSNRRGGRARGAGRMS